jgi:exosome complex component RRP41
MAPFSVTDRKSPGPDRRSTEISKVIRLALEPSLFLVNFPKVTVDVYIEVLQADGSTRVTGINAASLALADAGVPMRDLVAACSVGKINGTLIVDLCGKEDNNSEADVAVAMMPGKDEITLLQMDGVLTKEEVMQLIKTAKEKCKKIYEKQIQTLKEKYNVEDAEIEQGS